MKHSTLKGKQQMKWNPQLIRFTFSLKYASSAAQAHKQVSLIYLDIHDSNNDKKSSLAGQFSLILVPLKSQSLDPSPDGLSEVVEAALKWSVRGGDLNRLDQYQFKVPHEVVWIETNINILHGFYYLCDSAVVDFYGHAR